jgi:enoyl-CoA hydratase
LTVKYEERDHLAIITLDRTEARNAISPAVASGIEDAIDRYEANDALWAAILTGNGSVFCAGADLKEIAAGNLAMLSTEKGDFAGLVKRQRIKPLIAAVNGPAVAGGFEIVLACDLVVAATTARFGLPEVKRSLVAAAGGLFRLPRSVGKTAAMEMILTGDTVDAARAYELGLVNSVVEPGALMKEAIALADRIIANAPLAVRESRLIAEQALTETDNSLWALSANAIKILSSTEDYNEGPRAFIEKRPPVWKGK